MMRRIVGLMTSCMKYQGIHIHIEFKEKYNKKETMRSLAPSVEETSNLTVDSEEEDEEEEWVKAEDISSVITTHNHEIWQTIVRTLVPLATIVTHLIMSLKIV
jgi:hypothetical protein